MKRSIEHSTKSVKEKITSFLQQDDMTIEQAAVFIQHHPNTVISEKTLLGLTYRFFHLRTDQATFYAEARGPAGEHLLYVTAFTDKHVLFTYRSYDEHMSLQQPIVIEGIL
jgi:hypothetical protein